MALGDDAGDLLLVDEGRGDGVGGGQGTILVQSKSVKEIRSSDHYKCLKIHLTFHTINATRGRTNIFELNKNFALIII